ncbi:MAG: hypothetical protein NWR72_14285 [Bacteroidia bacterium]|nr:hypothetical protein [Bacteroidia bacterium]
MRAILYEYEQDLELLLSYLVEGEGFELQIAEEQDAFLGLCASSPPELIILGNCPPSSSHEEMIRLIRALPGLSETFILVLTTNPSFCDLIPGYQDTLISCVCTPITPKNLRETFREIKRLFTPTEGGYNQANVSR